MKNYLGQLAFGLVFIAGLALVVHVGLQPSATNQIPIRVFSSTEGAADALLSELNPELQHHSLLIVGLQPGKPELIQLFFDLLKQNAGTKTEFKVLLIDQELERIIPELSSLAAERINIQDHTDELLTGLRQLQEQQVRTLIVVPVPFAALLVPNSLAGGLIERGFDLQTLIFADFPRRRENEKNLFVPCEVASHDISGSGKLGCEILMTSRLFYRQRMKSNELVGVLNQLSSKDQLFLFTREP